jgi:hypothetical protein
VELALKTEESSKSKPSRQGLPTLAGLDIFIASMSVGANALSGEQFPAVSLMAK